ncbi:unnamed protein product [Blepharisma stoltei]|uniref:Cation/H+ exchanger transmembrane domain-containing protein n=1 Tax=Blepharisma stoltei TaxID=1481888 RepID=A0AAU9IQP3_9CILI|nr:unnamed protein product [Blepharisma stoltei]
MILGGILVGNLLHSTVSSLDKAVALQIRNISIAVILMKAGLGLDVQKLKASSAGILRLSIIPQALEASAIAVLSYLIFDMSWAFGYAMGFMIAAVSPAVLIPCLSELIREGYGLGSGIPSILMAANSLDNVIAIACNFNLVFGVLLNIGLGGSGDSLIFGDNNTVYYTSIGPIIVFGGIIAGLILGKFYSLLVKLNDWIKGIITALVSYGLVFVASYLSISGLGYLGVVISSTLAAAKWGKDSTAKVARVITLIWNVFQYALFGLVGTTFYFPQLAGDTVGKCCAIIVAGSLVRIAAAYYSVSWCKLTNKEKGFVGIAWLPKATIQAALGGVLLAKAQSDDNYKQYKDDGLIILTGSVFSILLTAPIGSILLTLFGPRLLQKSANEFETSKEAFAPLRESEASAQSIPITREKRMSEEYIEHKKYYYMSSEDLVRSDIDSMMRNSV